MKLRWAGEKFLIPEVFVMIGRSPGPYFAVGTFAMLALCQALRANATVGGGEIDAFFRPYVTTNNFSGSVLVERGDTVLFARSYGFADSERRIPNQLGTRFHVASLSILFTSTAVLRLIDQGKLSFDTHVSDIVSGVPNGNAITVRELLEQDSGLPDINDLPDYDDLLRRHQTPESLVARIHGLAPFASPGGRSQHEEHSGQNLLALIIERETGLPFAQAMKAEVFGPLGMHDSGVDDDSPIAGPVAQGHQLAGTFGLKAAPVVHWSAKSGNGSAYTTVSDEWKWFQGVVRGTLLSETSRDAMLETTDGYGWERRQSARLSQTVYLVGGRSSGFSSFIEYVPGDNLAIIALTNIENAANPTIVQDLAALLYGKPFQPFRYGPVPPTLVDHPVGTFVFGSDFYRPFATLRLTSDADGTTLNWPGGPTAPLLPIGEDEFIDRYYWIDVTVVRAKDGSLTELDYGTFKGLSAPSRVGAPVHMSGRQSCRVRRH